MENKSDIQLELATGYGEFTSEVKQGIKAEDLAYLNMEGLPIEVVVKDISKLDNKQFTETRRKGFGGSDSSMLLGVNPYQGWAELIKSKVIKEVSAEEEAVGELAAVRKGSDLEPIIMQKAAKALDIRIISPRDMYRLKDFPYLTMNFDGVGVFTDGSAFDFIAKHHGYAPVEIKVATVKGQRYYNPAKAVYSEARQYMGMEPYNQPPALLSEEQLRTWSIERKAEYFGIPQYYYTQVQQQIMSLDSVHGFLAVLFEVDWHIHVFFIQGDPFTQNALKVKGFQGWQEVERILNVKPEDSLLK